MIELLSGIALSLLLALYVVFKAWQKEAEKRTEAEEKVKAHETLQEIDEDIASGGDVYVNKQLLEITRPVRDNPAGDDIGA